MKLMLALTTLGLIFTSSVTVSAEVIRLAVTTSFNNSGLSDVLLPEIKADTDLEIQLLIVGTGQALKLGRSGDVDAILVHSREAEEAFIAQGFGIHRREIMYNDFVFIGPDTDPAEISKATSAKQALSLIAKKQPIFVSRGDESGTHKKEKALWHIAGYDPETFDTSWYRSVGAGMGGALNTASGMNAYIMSDRGSWLKFKNKQDMKLLFSGDPALFNQYSFLPVNPQKHPHVKDRLALRLENWLVSPKAQNMIADYQINGETLFTPNAEPKSVN